MSAVEPRLYQEVKRHIQGLGYEPPFIREDYIFADVIHEEYTTRKIPLATFAQLPPSYSNACIGVIIANG